MEPKRNLVYHLHIKLGHKNNKYGENKVALLDKDIGGPWRPWVARFFLTHVMT